MNEVKRYQIEIPIIKEGFWALKGSEPGELRIDKKVADVVLFTDFESERALRIDAEKKLRELQDAVIALKVTHVPIGSRLSDQIIQLRNNIFESRKKRDLV